MTNLTMNDLELAPAAVVRQAACDFAAALADTAQFKTYEQAEARLKSDAAAQAAMQAFQQRQQSLEALLMLNAVSESDRAELEGLREVFLSAPTVVAYLRAEAELKATCQAVGDILSQAIGLDFAASCRSGCC